MPAATVHSTAVGLCISILLDEARYSAYAPSSCQHSLPVSMMSNMTYLHKLDQTPHSQPWNHRPLQAFQHILRTQHIRFYPLEEDCYILLVASDPSDLVQRNGVCYLCGGIRSLGKATNRTHNWGHSEMRRLSLDNFCFMNVWRSFWYHSHLPSLSYLYLIHLTLLLRMTSMLRLYAMRFVRVLHQSEPCCGNSLENSRSIPA